MLRVRIIPFVWCFIIIMSTHDTVHAALSSARFGAGFNFGTSAFVATDAFYLGVTQDSEHKGAYALTRAAFAASNVGPDVVILPAAPQLANVNISGNDQEGTVMRPVQENPLYNQSIAVLTSLGVRAVALLETDTVAPILGSRQKIVRVNELNGQSVTTNIEVLNDSNGQPTAGIVALAGGMGPETQQQNIFAAVLPNGGTSFGGDGSGIGILFQGVGDILVPTDAQSGSKDGVTTGNRAAKLDGLLTTALTAITQDSSVIAINDMYWDMYLQRLFVALTVTRSNDASDGGVESLLVGQINEVAQNQHQLILRPAVALDSANFASNDTDQIFGFYSTDATPLIAQTYRVRTMHTTTGNSYAIVNGTVATTSVHNQVYALPLVQWNSDPAFRPPLVNVGRVANKNHNNQLAQGVGAMTLSSDPAALVGAGPLPSAPDQLVRVLLTSGDAVMVGLSGDNETGARDAEHEAGFFQSTALLDENGFITAWTPWQRVMGSVDRVLGGGFDPSCGAFMYLTDNGTMLYPDQAPVANTAKLTRWGAGFFLGKGDELLGGTTQDPMNGLVSLLSSLFIQTQGGVYELFDFPNTTPSFSAPGAVGNLAMMVATGMRSIALIQTGSNDGNVFSPTVGDFRSNTVQNTQGTVPTLPATTEVLYMTGGALSDIGPICCTAVSQAPLTGGMNGWLFVGGYNGLAVLSRADGTGWSTAPGDGLKSGFGNLTSDMAFRAVGNFGTVRSVLCDASFVYVLTLNALVRIPLDAVNFSAAGAPNPAVTVLATAQGVTGSAAGFRDMLLSNKLMLLATTGGLFRVGNGSDIQTASSQAELDWTQVLANGMSLGPVIQLFSMNAPSSGSGINQTAYVLAANLNSQLACVYRFAVADTSTDVINAQTVQLISQFGSPTFVSFGTIRENFVTDGATVLHMLPLNFGNIDLLKVFGLQVNFGGIADRGGSVVLGVPSGAGALIGRVVRSSASGAWIAPGDWGIRVQE